MMKSRPYLKVSQTFRSIIKTEILTCFGFVAAELGIKPEEIVKKFTAILTQRGFKEVSTYEDMAGALLVLFIFGILLLLVSKNRSLVSPDRQTDSLTVFIFTVERNLSVWKYLRSWLVGVFLPLLTNQFANKKRRLRGALLDHKYPRILTSPILLLSIGSNLFRPEEHVWSDLLRNHHCMVDTHSHSLLREQFRDARPAISYSIPNLPLLLRVHPARHFLS